MTMKPFMIIAAALTALTATAQQAWTLDSCVNYAVTHNLTVRSRQLEADAAELSITEARDRYLPSASAGVNQNWAFGRGLTAANTYSNRNTSQMGWSVGVELPLFQGLSAYRQEQLARENLAAMLETVEAVKDDVTLNVMAQYLQALYYREMLGVARQQRDLSQAEVERRRVLLDNGKVPETDLLEAQAQLASDELTVTTQENSLRLALLDLAQTLRLGPEAADFDIAPLPEALIALPQADEVYANALQHNHSLVAARRQIDVADRQIALAQTGYLPTLSFQLGAGSSYYHLNGEQNPSFSRQMRDNYATSLGFNLRIPIFDAFSTRNSVRRARVQRLQAELQYETAESDLYQAIQQAWMQARLAERKLASAESAETSTRAAFEAMQVKYNYGRANATEYERAKTTYINAVAERVQAHMELILRNRILDFYNRN